MFNYGWIVLVLTVLLEGLSGFGRTASFSPFLKDICHDLAVTSAQISLVYGLANLLTGIILPCIGRWYDRCSAKRFLRVFIILFGGSFIGMSALKVFSAPPFFNLFILFCGFAAIRLSVQSYMLTGRCMVAAWFTTHRGFATGLISLLLSSVASSMPRINLYLSHRFPWQRVWFFIGTLWLFVMFFLVHWIKKPPKEVSKAFTNDRNCAENLYGQRNSVEPNAKSKSSECSADIIPPNGLVTNEILDICNKPNDTNSGAFHSNDNKETVDNFFSPIECNNTVEYTNDTSANFNGQLHQRCGEYKEGTFLHTASEMHTSMTVFNEQNRAVSSVNTPELFTSNAVASSTKTFSVGQQMHTENGCDISPREQFSNHTNQTFQTSCAFWLIMVMFFFKAFQMTALAFHLVPMCEAFGARAEDVTLCLMTTPVVTVLTTFIMGHFFEKIGVKNSLLLFLLLDVSLLYSFQYIANGIVLCAYGLTAGAYWGMRQIVAYMVLPQLFGTKSIGAVNGWASACLCLGSATGPYMFAKCHEGHSYLLALNICQWIAVALLLVCFLLKNQLQPRYM